MGQKSRRKKVKSKQTSGVETAHSATESNTSTNILDRNEAVDHLRRLTESGVYSNLYQSSILPHNMCYGVFPNEESNVSIEERKTNLRMALTHPYDNDILAPALLAFLENKENDLYFYEQVEQSLLLYSKRMHIINFPIDETIWCLCDVEYVYRENDNELLRLMAVLNVDKQQTSTVKTLALSARGVSYKEHATRLLVLACINPENGPQRRPRYLFCRDTPSSRNVYLDIADLGIYFFRYECIPVKPSNWRNESLNIWIRQCAYCHKPIGNHISCDNCQVTVYCDEKCMKSDCDNTHHHDCERLKGFMEVEKRLKTTDLTFAIATTRRDFHQRRKFQFLDSENVYGKGLWRQAKLMEHFVRDTQFDGYYGKTTHDIRPFVLETENSVLMQPLPPDFPESVDELDSWDCYYIYRGFYNDSIVCTVLDFALTLFHIIKKRYFSNHSASEAEQRGKLVVHLIGAEIEAEMFWPFLECARLLRPLDLFLHLIGPRCVKLPDKENYRYRENLYFCIHQGLYHKVVPNLSRPDLAVAFNAGICAYTEFIPTVKFLLKQEVPFYITEFHRECMFFAENQLKLKKCAQLKEIALNPFRNLLRDIDSSSNLPMFNNLYLATVLPFEKTTENSKTVSQTRKASTTGKSDELPSISEFVQYKKESTETDNYEEQAILSQDTEEKTVDQRFNTGISTIVNEKLDLCIKGGSPTKPEVTTDKADAELGIASDASGDSKQGDKVDTSKNLEESNLTKSQFIACQEEKVLDITSMKTEENDGQS